MHTYFSHIHFFNSRGHAFTTFCRSTLDQWYLSFLDIYFTSRCLMLDLGLPLFVDSPFPTCMFILLLFHLCMIIASMDLFRSRLVGSLSHAWLYRASFLNTSYMHDCHITIFSYIMLSLTNYVVMCAAYNSFFHIHNFLSHYLILLCTL